MSSTVPLPVSEHEHERDHEQSRWARRRDIPIAILAWVVLAAIVLWGAGHIARTLVLLVLAALISYALVPVVKFLQRAMPRYAAIGITYLVVFLGIGLLVYIIVHTAAEQLVSLSRLTAELLSSGSSGKNSPLAPLIHTFGISDRQLLAAREQIVTRLGNYASDVVPLVTRFADFLLDIVVVAIMSIYFLIDGSRMARWCRYRLPRSMQAGFVLDTLQRVAGGYIRGQLVLSVVIGILVGGGLAILRVPYALLLGVLAFIFEFIPILGTLASGVICTLIALTHGWLIALIVLIYFVVVHIIEGDILGPRIVGKAIGLHPIVSIAAVIAGAELFGIVGALLASPLVGVIQSILVAFWINWRERHPEHFQSHDDLAQLPPTPGAA